MKSLFERVTGILTQNNEPIATYDPDTSVIAKKELIRSLVRANHFVMSCDVMEPIAIAHRENKLDLAVAPPFETCWFQLPNDGINPITMNLKRDNNDPTCVPTKILGLYLHEVSPQQYFYALAIGRAIPSIGNKLILEVGRIEPNSDSAEWKLIAAWLAPFKQATTNGAVQLFKTVKFRVNGQRSDFQIKRIVYVLPKKATSKDKENFEIKMGRKIDWSHRWFVRGHWRAIKGIGKNRAGEYVVQGFTFVIEHEKGREHVNPIRKTRIIVKDISDYPITINP